MTIPIESTTSSKRARLILKNGPTFTGYSFGAERSISGECVFQTGVVGYPESLTDPSYQDQILVLTYPLVGNYGVPSSSVVDENGLFRYFESESIHIAGLIVSEYSYDYSHWLAVSSLSTWLKEQNIPAIFGIDTRGLTKFLRSQGSTLGKMIMQGDCEEDVAYYNPNLRNLVAEVSTKKVQIYKSLSGIDQPYQVIAIDVGMKYNQIRCLVARGCTVKVVPWDYDYSQEKYDGIFISNGPGDPAICTPTVENLRKSIQEDKPIFGICLGHQLLSLAAGARTCKMLYGNRGHNIPCIDMQTGRCYITSQNHGYAVDATTLPEKWKEYFVNANDASNEGIYHVSKPFFSVQFHPEAAPGPRDSQFLFDKFVEAMQLSREFGYLVLPPPPTRVPQNTRVIVKKMLILGSGGLTIGQAGEFDYSGSQCIKALKEEGIYTVLINPNVATIQTSKGLADKVYFLPVNAEFVRKVIHHERPDGILVTFGGQTALNVGIQMKDEFESLGVKVLGTPLDSIVLTEDREMFATTMQSIGERCADSASATNLAEAQDAGRSIGYPLIIRAAYALGGLCSGFAENEAELMALCQNAFAVAPQVLIERSMKGWKEIEYEVVRDCHDNCITVCNMENFDPLGIHTGDSIVVAPSQTLSDDDYHRLRTTAIKVIRKLGIIGECNIQYAFNPLADEYYIIEVNARLSRSSALASKASGYPLAFVAAKLALGIPLTEIKNSVTKSTIACFEPSLDYVVVKIPRWDLNKFNRVNNKISSAMKSVGEVMAIGRTFEEAIQKAIRAVDPLFNGFERNPIKTDSEEELSVPDDQRLFAIANALHGGMSVERIHQLTNIDCWFIQRLYRIVQIDKALQKCAPPVLTSAENIPTPRSIYRSLLLEAKCRGFSDKQIALCIGSSELAVRQMRMNWSISPSVKQIDTVAAEFPCTTNYLYMTYGPSIESDVHFDDKGIIVLGSGVFRIGSSVEFDWCAVTAVRTLRQQGCKTIIINYNPETVSTDYDEADRLYFENIDLERVLDIYELEQSLGVIISMGGQTTNNIALSLHRQNVKILGTLTEQVDIAENRYKFSRMLDKLGVDQPQWKELTSLEEARIFCETVEYPVLVRPSYVLSGAAMNVVYSAEDLDNYLSIASAVSYEHPVVISKYIEDAKEIEMDCVANNGDLVIAVITEHVENAGVHSGDATLVLPPQDLSPETVSKVEDATRKIAHALKVTGPFNIQFIAKNNEIKVIECNLRASRSFPFVSKVLGVNLIEIATRVVLGLAPQEVYPPLHKMYEHIPYVAIKVPQFSFNRLQGADPILGVEMASTGEVACFGRDKYEAYLKALIATNFKLPNHNILLSIGSFKEKQEFLPFARKLHTMGYALFATPGTADFLTEHEIPVVFLDLIDEQDERKKQYSINDHIVNKKIDLYINLPSKNRYRRPASYMSRGYRTRRLAVDQSIPLITNVKCAKLFVETLYRVKDMPVSRIDCITEHCVVSLPGWINICYPATAELLSNDAMRKCSLALLATGCTMNVFCPFLLPQGYQPSQKLVQSALTDLIVFPPEHVMFARSFHKDSSSTHGLDIRSISPFMETMQATYTTVETSSLSQNEPSTPSCIIIQACGVELASMLYVASLFDKVHVHVTHVMTMEDVLLIRASKQRKRLLLSCDVCVYHLFFSVKDLEWMAEALAKSLPQFSSLSSETIANTIRTWEKDALGQGILAKPSDVEALWQNLDIVDCFVPGNISTRLHEFLVGKLHTLVSPGNEGEKNSSAFPLMNGIMDNQEMPDGVSVDNLSCSCGITESLTLLMNAVEEKRLSLEAVVQRIHHTPRRLLHLISSCLSTMYSSLLPTPPETLILVELDRGFIWTSSNVSMDHHAHKGHGYTHKPWSPLEGRRMRGYVERVVVRGEIMFLNGNIYQTCTPTTTIVQVEKSRQEQLPTTISLPKVDGESKLAAVPSLCTSLNAGMPMPLLNDQSTVMGSFPSALHSSLIIPPSPCTTSPRSLSPLLSHSMSSTHMLSAVSMNSTILLSPSSNLSIPSYSGIPTSSTISGSSVPATNEEASPLSSFRKDRNVYPGQSTMGTIPPPSSTPTSTTLGQTSIVPLPPVPIGPSMGFLSMSNTNSNPFYMKHILSVKQLTRHQLHALFGVAQEMSTIVESHGVCDSLLRGKIMCVLFYEPSTRTSSSFESAMLRLGGHVFSVSPITSSIAKGESLTDTLRTLESYADVIVFRHPSKGSAQDAARVLKVSPLINAGDGVGEHPSQALLDVYTIREELGSVNSLTITLVGDLKHGRTVHSLVRLLALYNVRIHYVSPPTLRMPSDIMEEVVRAGQVLEQQEHMTLDEILPQTDVLYMTRIQKERFSTSDEYEQVFDAYQITPSTLTRAKPNMIVMHPLPRTTEIDPSVDFDQRVAYFRQMRYGLHVRMALLAMIFGRSF